MKTYYRIERTGQVRNAEVGSGKLYQYRIEHVIEHPIDGTVPRVVGFGWGRNKAEALEQCLEKQRLMRALEYGEP